MHVFSTLFSSGFPGLVDMCLHVYVKLAGIIGENMVVLKVKTMEALMNRRKRWLWLKKRKKLVIYRIVHCISEYIRVFSVNELDN